MKHGFIMIIHMEPTGLIRTIHQKQQVHPSIGSAKSMAAVFWGLKGLIHVAILGHGQSFDSEFVCETVLPGLELAVKTTRPVLGLSGVSLHWDNARPHKSAALRIKELQHPPYSPDLAPCDFFLFGYLKNKIQGRHFRDENEIRSAITELFDEIQQTTLEDVFVRWKERLESVIENGGEYLP